jgi:hypothetical protein
MLPQLIQYIHADSMTDKLFHSNDNWNGATSHINIPLPDMVGNHQAAEVDSHQVHHMVGNSFSADLSINLQITKETNHHLLMPQENRSFSDYS